MEDRSWKIKAGRWKPEAGRWKLVLASRFLLPASRFLLPSSNFPLSIKKRIHLSFFALIALFLVYGIITIITIKENNELSRKVSTLLDPALKANADFNKLLIESKMYTTNWVFLRSNQEDKDALIDIQNHRYPELKSRITLLVSQLNNKQLEDSVNDELVRFELTMGMQRQVMSTLKNFDDYDDPFKRFNSENIIESDILPSTNAIIKTHDYIENVVLEIRTKARQQLSESSARLSNLIVGLIISVIIIGFVLASYMARIIIRPLDKIKNIINDLGKGIIKKVNFNATADEIGQMINSVNYLSEKLFAVAAFAIKVGNRNFDAKFEPLSDKDTLGKAVLSMRDKLKKNEKDLKETDRQMQLFFTNIDKVFFSMDWVNKKLLQMSPACEKIYGYTDLKFSLNPGILYDVIQKEDRRPLLRNFASIAANKSFEAQYRIRRKDGAIRWVETSITATLNNKNELMRIDGVTSDITERKDGEIDLQNKNVQLTKSNMELDKFVYSVSHDLRAPLSSMLGIIDISEDETKDELMLSHLSMMKGSIKKLDGFIKDILDYSRNARLEVRKEEINFKEVLADITANLKYMSGNVRKVDIKIKVDEAAPFRSDKSRINVVINNLVSNAIRYQNPKAEHPYVDIAIDTTEKEARIVVRDNGIGISHENQKKIFDMFYRVSESSVGSGLGLYIVKETVDKLNGRIRVESELGKRTEFSICIPNN